MKTPRIVDAIEKIDDNFIAEAAVYRPHKNPFPVWAKWIAAAACLCLCIVGAVKIWNPGMGCSQQVQDFFEKDGTLYFSTWEDGVFYWNPCMKKPQTLSETGRIANTNSGLILYSEKEQTLWEVSGFQLGKIGTFDLKEQIEDSHLIGIYNGYAYWCGEQKGLSTDTFESKIVRTPLKGGKQEDVVKVSDGLLLNCQIRGDFLYYHLEEFRDSKEKICARNLITDEEIVLTEFMEGDKGLPLQVYFMEDAIFVIDQKTNSLYQMDYTNGKPVFLTDTIPITGAFSEHDGKLYYQTRFGENECGSENLVSLDLETGELTKITNFALENGKGTIRYTLTKLAVTEGGFYFLDPHEGILYHDDAANTETEIYSGKS